MGPGLGPAAGGLQEGKKEVLVPRAYQSHPQVLEEWEGGPRPTWGYRAGAEGSFLGPPALSDISELFCVGEDRTTMAPAGPAGHLSQAWLCGVASAPGRCPTLPEHHKWSGSAL